MTSVDSRNPIHKLLHKLWLLFTYFCRRVLCTIHGSFHYSWKWVGLDHFLSNCWSWLQFDNFSHCPTQWYCTIVWNPVYKSNSYAPVNKCENYSRWISNTSVKYSRCQTSELYYIIYKVKIIYEYNITIPIFVFTTLNNINKQNCSQNLHINNCCATLFSPFWHQLVPTYLMLKLTKILYYIIFG